MVQIEQFHDSNEAFNGPMNQIRKTNYDFVNYNIIEKYRYISNDTYGSVWLLNISLNNIIIHNGDNNKNNDGIRELFGMDDSNSNQDNITKLHIVKVVIGQNNDVIAFIENDTVNNTDSISWTNFTVLNNNGIISNYTYRLIQTLAIMLGNVNWDEWFLPTMEKYIILPDCNTCDENYILHERYGKQSAYYMAVSLAGSTQLPIGRIGCDMNYDTYECHVFYIKSYRSDGYWNSFSVYNGINDLNDDNVIIFFDIMDSELSNIYEWGQCGFTICEALAPHSDDSITHCKTVTHEDLSTDNLYDEIIPHRKSSIGTNGNFCMYVRPKIMDYFYSYEHINGNDNDIEEANNRYFSSHKKKKKKNNTY